MKINKIPYSVGLFSHNPTTDPTNQKIMYFKDHSEACDFAVRLAFLLDHKVRLSKNNFHGNGHYFTAADIGMMATSKPLYLSLILGNGETEIILKDHFESLSAFHPEESRSDRYLFQVSSNDDANRLELAITKELNEFYSAFDFMSYSFELED